MSKIKRPYTLLTPGPVPLTAEVQSVLSEPTLHHREPEFKKIFLELQKKLQYMFQTKEQVLILTSSGTGAMEAGIVNTLSPGDEVICVCGGKFGERWRDISKAYGLKTHSIELDWGDYLRVEVLQEALKKYPKAQALCMVACETSTGTSHPIEELSSVLKNKDMLFILDGITALGAQDIKMDEWGVDILVGGSQKSMSIPTGLSMLALSKRAQARQKQARLPRFYFDLTKESLAQKRGETAFSPSVPLVKALYHTLDLFQTTGSNHFFSRSSKLAQATKVFCKSLDLSLLSKRASVSVTAILLDEDIPAEDVKKSLRENYRVTMAGGQGMLKNKLLRIGHLGPITNKNLLDGLQALGMELSKRKPHIYTRKRVQEALQKTNEELA